MTRTTHVPLWKRPIDSMYFTFFALHLIASLCVDIQGLVPAEYVPTVLQRVLQDYLVKSRDPLVPNACSQGTRGSECHFLASLCSKCPPLW